MNDAKHLNEAFRKHAAFGSTEQVKADLAAGAELTGVDDRGRTALHWAAVNRNPAVFDLLLKVGMDLNAADKDGELPLHGAARLGCRGQLTRALDGGCPVDAPTTARMTPLMLALAHGLADLGHYLLDRGADPGGARQHWPSVSAPCRRKRIRP